MKVEGVVYTQTMAMTRYASKLSGMYPTDALEVLKVESILGCYDELGGPIVQIMHLIKDEAEKAAKKKEFAELTCPKMFEYIQSLVSVKFVLGDKASVADIALYSIVHDYLPAIKDEFDVAGYPKIQSVIENFKAIPNVAEFIAKNH